MRIALTFLTLLLAGSLFSQEQGYRLREQTLNGVTEVVFENLTGTDVTVTFEFTGLENADLQGWPAKSERPCVKGDSVKVGTLFAVNGKLPIRYTHRCTYITGITRQKARFVPPPPSIRLSKDSIHNPRKEAPPASSPQTSDVVWVKPAPTEPFDPNYNYRLPFDLGRAFLCTQGYNGKVTHQGEYALDFSMPVGTPIHAARGGVVTMARGSVPDQVGNHVKKNSLGNGIQILHDDGTAANYHHIKHNGVVVKEYARVNKGDLIGYSGNTGVSSAPHLHFSVSKPGAASIPTVFTANGRRDVSIKEGVRYRADP